MNKKRISLLILACLFLVSIILIIVAALNKIVFLMYIGIALLLISSCAISIVLIIVMRKWLEKKAE